MKSSIMHSEIYLRSQLQRLRTFHVYVSGSSRSLDMGGQSLRRELGGVRNSSSNEGPKERPKYNASFNYSGNKDQNPEYMVTEDISFSDEMMRTLQVPLLTNDTKEEMYNRYIEEGLDYQALSNQYRTSIERTQAVIYMMGRKEEMLRAEGLVCFIPKRKGQVESEEDTLMRARSELWEKIFLEYEVEIANFLRLKEEAEDAAEASLPSNFEKLKFVKAQLKEAMAEFKDVKGLREKEMEYHEKLAAELAERYGVSKDEVDTAVLRMSIHYDRMEHMLEREEDNEQYKKELADAGADAFTFRETPNRTKASTMATKHFPDLFLDDDFHKEKKSFFKRLFEETKAEPLDMKHYLNKFGDTSTDVPPLSQGPQSEEDAHKALQNKGVLPPFIPAPSESRFKLAFRDLSKGKDAPTIIRTRTGKIRLATPLEEAFRTWTRHPKALDMELHKDKVAKYLNFDNDDDLPSKINKAKRERRKAMLEQYQKQQAAK